MTDDVLTFEELRNVQNRERESDTLQNLDEAFFHRARNYLAVKQDSDDHLQAQEYRNAKNILEDLLDLRQKKIVKLAFLSVKSDVTVENLLPHEEELFEEMKDVIGSYRAARHEEVFKDGETMDAAAVESDEDETEDISAAAGTRDQADDAGTDGPGDTGSTVVADGDEDDSPASGEDAGTAPDELEDEEADDGPARGDEAIETSGDDGGEEPSDDRPAGDAPHEEGDEETRDEEDDAEEDANTEDDGDGSDDGSVDDILAFDTEDEEEDGDDTAEADAHTDDEEDAADDDTIIGGDDGAEESGDIVADGDDSGADEEDDDGGGEDGDELVTVAVQEEVPEFMGTDLNAYGPFEEGEEVAIPPENAEVLEQQGKAERV